MLEAELLTMETEVRRAYGFRPAQVAGRPRRDEGATGPDPRVVAAAGWLRRVVPTLDDDWVAYLVGVVFGTAEWPGLLPQARRLLGEAERAFRPETPCPMCGALSLVARRPSTGLVACVNPACKDPPEGRPPHLGCDHLVAVRGEPGVNEDPVVDTAAAATAIFSSPDRVRQWSHRGLLERRGRDSRGRALYRLEDVFAVEKKLRRDGDAGPL
jgi:hypothetical protein